MNIRPKRFTAVSVFCFSSIVASGYGWDEPRAFGPLKFDESVAKQLPECSIYESNLKPCWQRPYFNDGRDWDTWLRTGSYQIKWLKIGDMVIPNILAFQVEDKIERLFITLSHSSFSMWLKILTERYGKPTTITESVWMSKAGVKVPNSTVRWIGEDIHITLTERGAKIDETSLTYSTKAGRDRAAEREKETHKKAVEGL